LSERAGKLPDQHPLTDSFAASPGQDLFLTLLRFAAFIDFVASS
jgi:hypothetical protein